jgi:hypothetical protein
MYRVENYQGTLQFGEYKADYWFGADNINAPIVQNVINRVKSRPELFEGFELYIIGGILEGWLTWDIDWVLIGPYNPSKIKQALHWITAVGFDAGLYPDVTYTDKIFDVNDWQNTKETQRLTIYRTSNLFIKNGIETKNLSHYFPKDGLYTYQETYPLKKQIERLEQGYKYQKPFKIF